MEKEQCAILVAMVILIAIATIGFIHTLTANGLTSKVLPRILLDGTPLNLTGNDTVATNANLSDLQKEILRQAIESYDG